MAKTVSVGCKLPNGIILHHPLKPEISVTLNGRNAAPIIGSDHGKTDVDAEFWDAWISANATFAPLTSGAIFVAKNAESLAAVAAEYKERTTGLEPMRTDGKDPRAKGVKTNVEKE